MAYPCWSSHAGRPTSTTPISAPIFTSSTTAPGEARKEAVVALLPSLSRAMGEGSAGSSIHLQLAKLCLKPERTACCGDGGSIHHHTDGPGPDEVPHSGAGPSLRGAAAALFVIVIVLFLEAAVVHVLILATTGGRRRSQPPLEA